jgi:23S rRNA (adenine2503-C2)-methyltransferase
MESSKNASSHDIFSVSDYSSLMKDLKQPRFRAKQLAHWLWVRGIQSYDEMNNMPLELREELKKKAPLQRASIEKRQLSKDGTRKYLLRFADGVSVEAVALPSTTKETGDAEGKTRLSVCISSQAGCALACSFCATGRGGLTRNLLPGEILEQLRIVSADFGQRANNVVVMGQGEPFLNYDAVMAALRVLNTPENKGGFGIGARHITLSSAGIIEGINALAKEPEQFTLAVSLHSAIQGTRDTIMPGLRGQSLSDLAQALIHYYEKTGRRPSLEYALIQGINTSPAEIKALISFAKKTKAHVNLIPLNTIEKKDSGKSLGSAADVRAGSALRTAAPADAVRIAGDLRGAGIEVSIRKERGSDIAAACGQLAQN